LGPNESNAMNSKTQDETTARVKITVRFVSIMQKYSGNRRDVQVEVQADSQQAINRIIDRFQIPWEGNLERSTRIFINKTLKDPFLESGKQLKDGDIIEFIPISGGG